MLSLSAKGQPPPSTEAPAAHRGSVRARSLRPKILVVDDIAANRMMLEIFLTRNGFDVVTAESGEQAVAHSIREPFDAILMDLHMPVVDGYEAARRIRAAEPPGRRTLLLAVTAAVGSEVRAKCLAAGMDEHFAKPLNLVTFCRTLTHLVSVRRG